MLNNKLKHIRFNASLLLGFYLSQSMISAYSLPLSKPVEHRQSEAQKFSDEDVNMHVPQDNRWLVALSKAHQVMEVENDAVRQTVHCAGGVTVKESLVVDGLVRTALVHLPCNYEEDAKQYPLVLVLHGARLNGKIAQEVTGFDKWANQEGFVVAYPTALNHQWNDGRNPGDTPSGDINDTKFLLKLMDSLAVKYHADPSRIYITGYSSGGMMAQKMAMEYPQRIAAIAPVASSIPQPLYNRKLQPSLPVPVLMINGTDDHAFPWEGGNTRILGVKVGDVLPVHKSLQYWINANGGDIDTPESIHCASGPAVQDEPTSVDVEYHHTKKNACVLLYKVNNGGHTWPGSEVPLNYIPFLGRQNRDLSASELIWQFFKRYTREQALTSTPVSVTPPSSAQINQAPVNATE